MQTAKPGRGVFDELDRVLDAIQATPEQFGRLELAGDERVRRASMRRFPFIAAFRYQHDEAVVFTVAHEGRGPKFWRNRLSS